ncbi:MAG: protoporphyrinogen oxidase [Candidatus Hydrogenedentota bacterium]
MKYETRVAVLGGGVTGLCAAHYLGETIGRTNVILAEASDSLGGTTRTDEVDGFLLDWGPNGFLNREPLTLKWVEDLGLSPDMVTANEKAAHRFVLKDNVLHEVYGPPRFLLSPLLSIPGRLRLLCEPLISTRKDESPETIWNFAARRIGREAADTLVSSMVSGVFGGDARQLSLQHCFPKMAAMEREFGSLFKALMAKKRENKTASAMGPSGVLTSFKKGIGFLPREAGSALGARAITNAKADSILRNGGHFHIKTESGDDIEAEAVVVALPAYAAAGLLARFDDALAKSLSSVAYADLAVVCTAYDRDSVGHDLNGFGFLIPRTEKRRALGCLWTSSIFPNQAPDKVVLLRTMLGGFTDPDAVRLSDAELLDVVKREIHPLLSIGKGPGMVRIYRHYRGIPQYLLHHGEVLSAIDDAEQRHKGLFFAGNAYRGVGLNDCVVSAVRAAERCYAEFGSALRSRR